jgi:colanic acid biosynthesis protein WcaH
MPDDDPVLTPEELRSLEGILAKLSGPGGDLPAPLFRFITAVAPTPNVDLLVQDAAKGTLLAWRDDAFGTGWHVPGSLIRPREEVADRLAACARDELGCAVAVEDRPVALTQIFDDRGHSLGLCHRVRLRGEPGRRLVAEGDRPEAGDLRWFPALPEALYPSHAVYRDILAWLDRREPGEGIRLFTQHANQKAEAEAAPGGRISPKPPLAGSS